MSETDTIYVCIINTKVSVTVVGVKSTWSIVLVSLNATTDSVVPHSMYWKCG